jgi:hypothetical protein
MEIVEKFLKCRRDRNVECAEELLDANATLGSPWGYHHGPKEYHQFLADEVHFDKRGYLYDGSALERIDDNTFQRKYQYDRGMAEYPPYHSPYYREMYFVKDGKLRFVSCAKQNLMIPWNV